MAGVMVLELGSALENGVEVRLPLTEQTTQSNQPEVGLTGAIVVV